MARDRGADRSYDDDGQIDSYQPGASIWPLVAVAAAALAIPGLVHGLPLAVQVGLVVTGVAVGVVAMIGWFHDDLRGPQRVARWRIVTASTDAPAPYSPPATRERSERDTALHLRAVKDVASHRFSFPNDEHRDYKVCINHPRNTMGVRMPGGYVAYPDIVVVQSPENYTKIIAQVETAETVNEDVAYYLWGPYAELAPLYLYVPVGSGDKTLALCRKLEVPVVGIRTWRYLVGFDELDISDHYTA